MVKAYLFKYALILIILHSLIINANSKEINSLFYKIGYIKKPTYNFSIFYTHYTNNNNFTLNSSSHINSLDTGYKAEINTNNIIKSQNGIKAEFAVQVLPPIRLFINYNYKISKTKFDYTLPYKSLILLLKDYSSSITISDEEHTFMSGFDFMYEYKYKNIVPYINFKTAVGITASTNYKDIYYSLNLALTTGLIYNINKNMKINSYIGADYTSIYNGNYINDTFSINIPKEFLQGNLPLNNITTQILYNENYNKNLNMVIGAEFELFKHYGIFIETKFINNFILNFGAVFKW